MTENSSQPVWPLGAPLEGGSHTMRVASARLGSLARRVAASRPAIAWSLSLLFLFKGMVCLATVAFPIGPQEPTGLIAIAGALAVTAASGVWLFGVRIPVLGFQLLAAGGSLTTSWVVAHAATHGGMMIAAFSYPWIAIYAAHFFPRRGVIFQGVLISVGFGAGLLFGGLAHVGIYWAIVTVTIWSICLVLGHLSESLRRRADTDPLTGLLNRSGFLTAANREHAIAERSGNPLTLAVLDLDGFKRINDLRGHMVGDRLLAELGSSWRARLRAGDILARHGGDEFVLLLPATAPESAPAVLERLRVENLPVTWSIGIGEWLPGERLDECIARADADLYSVKNAMRQHGLPGPVEPVLRTA
jgi:diguanylate cyclase (GGDEF)-like protein